MDQPILRLLATCVATTRILHSKVEWIIHSAFEWIIFGVATQVAESLIIGCSSFLGHGRMVQQLGIGWCNLLGFIRV